MSNVYPKASAFEAAGSGVTASPKFPALEEAVLDYWKKDNTFAASIANRPAGKNGENEFVFYDGPPFATACPTTATCSPATPRTSSPATRPSAATRSSVASVGTPTACPQSSRP